MFQCKECQREFKSQVSLNGHTKVHTNPGTKEYTYRTVTIGEFEYSIAKDERELTIRKYHENPVKCTECGTAIRYESRKSKFCGHACATKDQNRKRPPMSKEQKRKISETLTKKIKEVNLKRPVAKGSRRITDGNTFLWLQKDESLPHGWSYVRRLPEPRTRRIGRAERIIKEAAKLSDGSWNNRCMHCDNFFVSQARSKYCPEHADLYKSNGRNRYAFTFNVFHYPELFDLELIKDKGWHSHGGRYDYNPEGLTRDHRVSVNESIRNGYDPYYIKHPVNCEIMTFSENDRKKARSSISYEDLVKEVDMYEQKKTA